MELTLEKPKRITSIDFLRGLIMVIMALDHSRDFLHFDAWTHDPLDFRYTTPLLFLTRWVTHYCAPNFIFLAGLSAYLYGQRTGNNLTKFLITRGLWLIFLEFFIFKYLWTGAFLGPESWNVSLNLHFTTLKILFSLNITALVIWAIGITMIFLAVWHKLPYHVILATGLLIVFLHNLADPYKLNPNTALGKFWSLLHVMRPIGMGPFHIFVLYPVLPYFGLICLGYCAGKLYTPSVPAERRQRTLVLLGVSCIALFIILRMFNIYGDAAHFTPFNDLWSTSANYIFSILSFINTTKYPCSLLYILMTVGPALILLAIAENMDNPITRFFINIGRVPMFYYILHLFLYRLIVSVTPWHNSVHLPTVYFAWLFVVFVLYYPCIWYAKYKAAHPEKWWLSYI
jgi:uncharacterized membrane protein